MAISDVRFSGPGTYDGGSFRAELGGPSLDASVGVFIYDFDGIDEYFRELADSWRGWDGKKTWRSVESHMTVEATALSSGHRRLRFAIQDRSLPTCGAWVEVDVEGGEEMSRIASALTDLVDSARLR